MSTLGHSTRIIALATLCTGLSVSASSQTVAPVQCGYLAAPGLQATTADHIRYQTQLLECLRARIPAPAPVPTLDSSIYKLQAPPPVLNPLDLATQGARLRQIRAETEALRAQTEALRASNAAARAVEQDYESYFAKQLQDARALLESAADRPAMQRWMHLSAATLEGARTPETWRSRWLMLRAQGAPPAVLEHFGENHSALALGYVAVLVRAWDR